LQCQASDGFQTGRAQACYVVRAVAERLWRPLAERAKDYIAAPKPNGYQSLHITLRVPGVTVVLSGASAAAGPPGGGAPPAAAQPQPPARSRGGARGAGAPAAHGPLSRSEQAPAAAGTSGSGSAGGQSPASPSGGSGDASGALSGSALRGGTDSGSQGQAPPTFAFRDDRDRCSTSAWPYGGAVGGAAGQLTALGWRAGGGGGSRARPPNTGWGAAVRCGIDESEGTASLELQIRTRGARPPPPASNSLGPPAGVARGRCAMRSPVWRTCCKSFACSPLLAVPG
jgi:hypothetical protein